MRRAARADDLAVRLATQEFFSIASALCLLDFLANLLAGRVDRFGLFQFGQRGGIVSLLTKRFGAADMGRDARFGLLCESRVFDRGRFAGFQNFLRRFRDSPFFFDV